MLRKLYIVAHKKSSEFLNFLIIILFHKVETG